MHNLYNQQTIVNHLNHNVHEMKNIMTLMSLHIGDYKLSCRTDDFLGWLKCDGRVLSRTDYKHLFDIIGTSFNNNDPSVDSNSFKLPDFRGRVLGMPGHGTSLTNRTMGVSIGAETHTLSTSEIPSHSHSASASTNGSHTHTINDPGHTHTMTTINDDFNNSGTSPPGFTQDSAGTMTWNIINNNTTGITVNANGDHTHTITVQNTGGGQSHNNMQPTLFGANVFIFSGILENEEIYNYIRP